MSTIDVIVETPRGSVEKYDFDEKLHLLKLKKILPAGMVFPYDFGFIPDTKGEDGDPLDIIVLSEFHSFPGCMIECKLIGCIEAEQSREKGSEKMIRNDRYIAVPTISQMYGHMDSIKSLPDEILRELEQFFINYNKIEGKEFKVVSLVDAKESKKMIKSNRK
jgi:inorganic pyrophosphatase